jgi:hypothetical protein
VLDASIYTLVRLAISLAVLRTSSYVERDPEILALRLSLVRVHRDPPSIGACSACRHDDQKHEKRDGLQTTANAAARAHLTLGQLASSQSLID